MSMNLDELFSPGPDGFLDGELSRARRYVCAVSGLEPSPGALPEPAPYPDPQATDFEQMTGSDAWQNDAMRRWFGLWSGDTRTVMDVLGLAPPDALVQFERAIQGAKAYETFHELRLDTKLMGLPPTDQNLFEKCILNDQLNFLGTALSEVFAGVACLGGLGNGDSYHLELLPHAESDPHTVVFFDHERRTFTKTLTEDLGALVYLCALVHAADNELVSSDVADAGFQALRNKVAPTWHFGIDERDEDFEPYEQERGTSVPMYLFWRAYWIICLLRHDGMPPVDELEGVFTEKLNVVVSEADVAKRLEFMPRRASVALYIVWRAYLFDEPALEQYMNVCRTHPARLVRDAAKLIEELRAGRKVLGRISDWPALLERFRALELDPRLASERAAKAQATREQAIRDREALRASLERLEGDAELDAVARVFHQRALNFAALQGLLSNPSRQEARRGVDFLVQGLSSRDGKSFAHEDGEACVYVARRSDPALTLVLLGIALFGSDAEEGQRTLDGRKARDILLRTAGELPAAGIAALVQRLETLEFDEHPGWQELLVPRLAGHFRVKEAVPVMTRLIEKMPNEGELRTAMTYDEFIAAVADAFVQIGAGDTSQLLRFAKGDGLYMRQSRVKSALALARLAPKALDEAACKNLFHYLTELNDAHENGWSLLAIARSGVTLEGLATVKPSAHKYPQVRLARAIATGGDVEAALHECFSKPGYDQKADLEQIEFALLTMGLFGVKAPATALQAAMGLASETDEALARAGGLTPPRWLTWFEVEDMNEAELIAVVQDPTVHGREHAARRLHGVEAARTALEQALTGLTEVLRFRDRAGYLAREAVSALLELDEAPSTVAVMNEMLLSPNKELCDPVLRASPDWAGLRTGMEHVAATAKGGWMKSEAESWLERNAGSNG